MIFFRKVAGEILGQFLEIDAGIKRHDDQGHEEFLRAQKNLRMRMLGVNPESPESGVGVVNPIPRDPTLVHNDVHVLRHFVDEKREGKDGREEENGEDDVAEDDGSDRYRYRDDAHGPEPVRAPLLVFVLVGIPLHFEGLLFNGIH